MIVDFDALKLTPEQNRLALHFFDKIMLMVMSDDAPSLPDTGVALSVALTEFLGSGIRSGLAGGFLSEERARILVTALSNLLPKAS